MIKMEKTEGNASLLSAIAGVTVVFGPCTQVQGRGGHDHRDMAPISCMRARGRTDSLALKVRRHHHSTTTPPLLSPSPSHVANVETVMAAENSASLSFAKKKKAKTPTEEAEAGSSVW